MVLTRGDGRREEVDLEATGRRAEPEEKEFTWPEAVAVTCDEVKEAESTEESAEEIPETEAPAPEEERRP